MKVATGKLGQRRWAFTLVELLVVIAIIGILVGILLPAIGAVRDNARRTQNSTNLRSIGQAIASYEASKKQYPPMVKLNNDKLVSDKNGNPLDKFKQLRDRNYSTSWAFEILPYLDQANIYDKHDTTQFVYHGFTGNKIIGAKSNQQAFASPIPTYANPRKRDATADCPIPNAPGGERGTCIDYAANAGIINDSGSNQLFNPKELAPNEDVFKDAIDNDGRIHQNHPLKYGLFNSGPFTLDSIKISSANIRDGVSNVIAVGDRFTPEVSLNQETYDECGLVAASLNSIMRFGNPSNGIPPDYSAGKIPFPHDVISDTSPFKFGTNRGSDACFVYLDGHVRWIAYSTDTQVFALLCVIGDGEPAQIE